MSDTSQGPGWWQASDGKWYPPESSPGASPAYSGGGGGGAVDIGGAISYGWTKFSQNAGPLIVATLLPWVAHLILTGGVGLVFKSIIVRSLWSLLVTVIVAVLTMGLAQISLKIVRGEGVEMSDAFPGGPMVVAYAITAIVADLILGVGFTLCIIPGLLIAPFFIFAHFVVLDEGLQPGDALSRSIQLGKVAYGSVIGFVIVAFLVNLVGLLVCCVGLLVSIPLTSIAAAHVYKGLKGERVAA
jgi:hypothetical protein